MPYTAVLRRVSDGAIRASVQHDDWTEEDDATQFYWTDGNCGCDCVRHRLFQDAGHEPMTEHPCTSNAYECLGFRLSDGSIRTCDDVKESADALKQLIEAHA